MNEIRKHIMAIQEIMSDKYGVVGVGVDISGYAVEPSLAKSITADAQMTVGGNRYDDASESFKWSTLYNSNKQVKLTMFWEDEVI